MIQKIINFDYDFSVIFFKLVTISTDLTLPLSWVDTFWQDAHGHW